MTRDEAMARLSELRFELAQTQRQRDRWKESAELHIAARREAVRRKEQADNDADAAWLEVERLREQLGMDCCEGGVRA